MDEDETSIARGQLVIYDHVQPLPVGPQVEVEDPRVSIRVLCAPFLFVVIRNDLERIRPTWFAFTDLFLNIYKALCIWVKNLLKGADKLK